jgi:predicted RNA binding protein YcfA (HicA-like mRNA interferase family)
VSTWPSAKAERVHKALLRIGWYVVSQKGSHQKLRHASGKFPDYVWPFHNEELGPPMIARISKKTGLKPEDL